MAILEEYIQKKGGWVSNYIRVGSNIDMVIFHINKRTCIPVDLHRYKMRSFGNTVLSRIDNAVVYRPFSGR